MSSERDLAQRLYLVSGLAVTRADVTDEDVANAERDHKRRTTLSGWDHPTEDPVQCVRRGFAAVLAKPRDVDWAKVEADARAKWNAMSSDERRRMMLIIAGAELARIY